MRRSPIYSMIAFVFIGGCRDLPTVSDPSATAGFAPALSLSAQAIGCDANALIDALNAANAAGGGIIDLSADCTYQLTAINNYSADFGINGLPIVTGDVTINGNGATIERDGLAPDFRIFYVLNSGDPAQGPGRLTLNAVTISGGKFSNSGGALVNNGGAVIINYSTISGNESGDSGGGVSNLNGTLTLNHTLISGNEAADAGGGVSSTGGTLTINHATISGNESGDNGGGLSNAGGTVFIINGATISQNTTADHGGGLSNLAAGIVTIDNSAVSGNFAADDGGGVSNDGGSLEIINGATISGNEAGDDGGGVSNTADGVVTIRGSTLADNAAGETGGALYNYDATATVAGITAFANRAKWGGAMFSEGGETAGSLTVRNSTIAGNHAAEAGGGVFNYKGGHLVLTNSTIAGNDATIKPGGGVLSYNDVNGAAVVKGSIIAGNVPDDVAAVEDKTRFSSLGYNLVGAAGPLVDLNADFSATGDQRNADPALGPLQNNGGATFTRALLAGSPALDAMPTDACTDDLGGTVTADQRGVARPAGSACDIGAFEEGSAPVPQTITFTEPASPKSYGAAFTVNPTASSGLRVSLSVSGGCTATGYDVTVTSGTVDCVLTASQAGDANNSAAANVIRTVDAQRVALTVSVTNETIAFGGTPSFEVAYSGFAGTDGAGVLGGTVVLTFQGTGETVYGPSTTVPQDAGTYSVTPGGHSSDDYAFDYVAGAFIIEGGISFESQSTGANASATTLTIAGPVGVKAGDLLLAQVVFEKGSDAGSNAQITPAGWTLVRRTNRGTDLGQAIFYRVAGAAEPSSYTWTFPFALKAAGGILRYLGVNTSAPIVASSGSTGDSGTLTAPSVGAEAKSVVVGAFGFKKTSTSLATPPGMTSRYYFEGPLDLTTHGADETRAAAGATGSRTSTAGHADKWIAQLVALRAN